MKEKGKFIFGIVLIILLFVMLLLVNNKEIFLKDTVEKNNEDELKIETRIDYDNLKNAEIINGEKVNVSNEIKDSYAIYDDGEQISKLLVKNVKITSDREKDVSYFRATLINKDTKVFESNMLSISFFDKNYKYLSSVDCVITEKIKPGESLDIEVYDLIDFINAYDYDVRILP